MRFNYARKHRGCIELGFTRQEYVSVSHYKSRIKSHIHIKNFKSPTNLVITVTFTQIVTQHPALIVTLLYNNHSFSKSILIASL